MAPEHSQVGQPPIGDSGGAGGADNVDLSPPEAPPDGPRDCLFQESQGLWWEIKSDVPGHLRESGGTYSWFLPEYGKRLEGIGDKGECTAIQCDTQSYIDAVNALFLCGKSDWRLPTSAELLLFPDRGSSGDDFPPEENFYWSSDLNPDDPDVAQAVYLCCGGIETPAVKTGAGRVLLVRDGVADDAP